MPPSRRRRRRVSRRRLWKQRSGSFPRGPERVETAVGVEDVENGRRHMSNEQLRIVIIGGVACGPKAAARARRRDANAKITLIERSKFVSYAG